MSKNLEKEYRAFVNSEVPDLWSRIDAGLDEKTTAGSLVSRSDPGTGTELTDPRMTTLHKKGHLRKSSFKVWAGLAAACACVVLILPAMMRTMWTGGSSGSSSDNMAPDHAPQPMEAYDMAGGVHESGASYIDGAAGGAQETAYEDSVAEAAEAAADNSGIVNSSTTSENVYVNSNTNSDSGSAVDPGLNADADNAVHSDTNVESVNAAAPVEAAESEKYKHKFEVTVEILDTDVRMNSGILYTAKVVTSGDSDIQVDSEIKIFGPAILPEGVAELENAETYELILCEKLEKSEKDPNDLQQEKIYVIVEE